MTDDRTKEAAQTEEDPDQPVPRDPPDQQAQEGGDKLDIPRPESLKDDADEGDGTQHTDPDDKGQSDKELPDADESGAGPTGKPRSGSVHPEQPVPDEPSG